MKTSYRQQLDPRNTFDYSTPGLRTSSVPQLSPVYKDVSSKGMGLAQALGTVSNTIQAIQPFMNQYAQAKYEEGQLAALTGEDKPTKGYFQVKAYEEAEGELIAQTKYKQELMDFYTDNYTNLDPEQWQQGLEEISQKYLNGQSENFIRTFVPKAVELETSLNEQYQNYLRQETHAKSLNAIGGISDVETGDLVNNMLREGFQGVENIEDFLSNPYLHGQLSADKDFRSQLSMSLRTSLNGIQARGCEMGLSRREISSQYIRQLGKMAVSYGMPELLDMAYEMDESGVSLAKGELADVIDRYKAQAEDNRLRIKQFAEQQQKEVVDNRNHMFKVDTFTQLGNLALMDNPYERAKAASDMLTELTTDNPMWYTLSRIEVETLTKSLTGYINNSNKMAFRDNENVARELWEDIHRDTKDALSKVIVAGANGELTLDTYNRMYKQAQNNLKAQQDAAMIWQDKDMIMDTLSWIPKTMFNELDINVQQQRSNLWGTLNSRINEWKETHDGIGPTWYEYQTEIMNPVLENYGTSYNELVLKGEKFEVSKRDFLTPIQTQIDDFGNQVVKEKSGVSGLVNALPDWVPFASDKYENVPKNVADIFTQTVNNDFKLIKEELATGTSYRDATNKLGSITGNEELANAVMDSFLLVRARDILKAKVSSGSNSQEAKEAMRQELERYKVSSSKIKEILEQILE